MLSQIANIPLEWSRVPIKIQMLKGCQFTPALYLPAGKLWFFVVTFKRGYRIQPGFYPVPERGDIAWVKGFKPYAMSERSAANGICYVFEAIEGDPLKDAVPVEWEIIKNARIRQAVKRLHDADSR